MQESGSFLNIKHTLWCYVRTFNNTHSHTNGWKHLREQVMSSAAWTQTCLLGLRSNNFHSVFCTNPTRLDYSELCYWGQGETTLLSSFPCLHYTVDNIAARVDNYKNSILVVLFQGEKAGGRRTIKHCLTGGLKVSHYRWNKLPKQASYSL